MQDLPACRSRKIRTNTHQRFSKPILSSFRSPHHTQTPVLFRTTIFVYFHKNCNFLISLCYLIVDASARSKQRILKTFAKLAEKADRQPVCIKLKLKNNSYVLQMAHNCASPANFKNIHGNRSKIPFIIYCVMVGTNINKGNNYFVTYINK